MSVRFRDLVQVGRSGLVRSDVKNGEKEIYSVSFLIEQPDFVKVENKRSGEYALVPIGNVASISYFPTTPKVRASKKTS
jgi:hypothetical protein